VFFSNFVRKGEGIEMSV